MRTGVPASFLSAFSSPGAKIAQVLVFHWQSGNQFVSDRSDVFGYACSALVTDWGTLDDAVDISKAVNGSGSPTRQMTVSLLNTSDTGWFCSKFASEHPENVRVDLWQLVEDIDGTPEDSIRIDTFYIQSPIEYNEGELTVSLTLVSVNQFIDPFIGTLDPVTNKFYGVVIGSMSGVPGTLYGSHPWAKLSADLAAGSTVIPTDRNLAQAGFPSSGSLTIDYETISYTGISGNNFIGVGGVSKLHKSGQYIFVPNHEYLFAFGAGPVDVAGPVYVDGNIYSDCTIYKSRNPVQVGFMGGFPWVDDGDIIESRIEIESTDGWVLESEATVREWSGWTGISDMTDNIRNRLLATKSFYPSGQQNDYYFYTVDIYVKATCNYGGPIYGILSIYYGGNLISSWNSKNGDVNINYYTTNGNEGMFKLTVSSGYPSTGDTGARTVVSLYNESYVSFKWKKFLKKYSQSISLQIGQSGSYANPSDVIAWILAKKNCGAYIDQPSFLAMKNIYTIGGYKMAGFIDGGKRCSEALVDVLYQCKSYIVWNGGKVFLRNFYDINVLTPVYTSTATVGGVLGNRVEKSIRITRQEFVDSNITGKRENGVINYYIARYNRKSLDGDYLSRYETSNASSVAKFGKQEEIHDLYLVGTSSFSDSVSEYWLSQTAYPYTVLSFTATAVTADIFCLELGDIVKVITEFSGISNFTGRVAKISRTFGSMPKKQTNLWNVTLVGWMTR